MGLFSSVWVFKLPADDAYTNVSTLACAYIAFWQDYICLGLPLRSYVHTSQKW